MTDVEKYPIYIIQNGKLVKKELWELEGMTFYKPMEYHHFVKKQQFKRNPEKYKDIQKLILLERDFHRSLPAMSEERVLKLTGIKKKELLYNG